MIAAGVARGAARVPLGPDPEAGADALADAGFVPPGSYILAAEPSDGKVLIAQKGVAWYEDFEESVKGLSYF